jgi:hypothetical protein
MALTQRASATVQRLPECTGTALSELEQSTTLNFDSLPNGR